MDVRNRAPSMGVMKLNENDQKFQLMRYAPSEDLAPFIKHFWIINWDLTDQHPHIQDVIPNPCVNLVVQKQVTGIYGVAKNKYSKFLQGKECVFGVKFKPGGFYPFLQTPISQLTDQSIRVSRVFDVDEATLENKVIYQKDHGTMIEYAEEFIKDKLPKKDPTVDLINRMIERITEDHDMIKVDQLCQHFDMNKRTLQRIFDKYIGVSPKWVIKLYRLQNAAEKIDHGQHHDWASLSMDLGYYDQSHFIRDFKAIIGKTPQAYASDT